MTAPSIDDARGKITAVSDLVAAIGKGSSPAPGMVPLAASAYWNLAGVRVRLDLVSFGDHIVPGITARDAVGHSPGQLALEIASANERLLFVADAVIHPISLEYPDTRAMGDHLPEPMVATRMRLLREAAETRCLVAVSHFPFPGLGRVLANGDRWAWQPIASSAEPR